MKAEPTNDSEPLVSIKHPKALFWKRIINLFKSARLSKDATEPYIKIEVFTYKNVGGHLEYKKPQLKK